MWLPVIAGKFLIKLSAGYASYGLRRIQRSSVSCGPTCEASRGGGPFWGWPVRQHSLELWQILHPGQRWWWQPLRSLFHPLLKSWQAATTREESWGARAGQGASG